MVVVVIGSSALPPDNADLLDLAAKHFTKAPGVASYFHQLISRQNSLQGRGRPIPAPEIRRVSHLGIPFTGDEIQHPVFSRGSIPLGF